MGWILVNFKSFLWSVDIHYSIIGWAIHDFIKSNLAYPMLLDWKN